MDQPSRPDVTARPGNRFNLDNSGFKARSAKRSLEKGRYQLGIIIKNRKTNKEQLTITDKIVEITD